MLRLLGLFDPFLREFVEMHYLLADPLIVDDSALQRLMGNITKTPYSEGVRQSLAAASPGDGRSESAPESAHSLAPRRRAFSVTRG